MESWADHSRFEVIFNDKSTAAERDAVLCVARGAGARDVRQLFPGISDPTIGGIYALSVPEDPRAARSVMAILENSSAVGSVEPTPRRSSKAASLSLNKGGSQTDVKVDLRVATPLEIGVMSIHAQEAFERALDQVKTVVTASGGRVGFHDWKSGTVHATIPCKVAVLRELADLDQVREIRRGRSL